MSPENDRDRTLVAPDGANAKAVAPIEGHANSAPAGEQAAAAPDASQSPSAGSPIGQREFYTTNRDIQSLVKGRPGVALGAAVVFGFMLGRLLSRP